MAQSKRLKNEVQPRPQQKTERIITPKAPLKVTLNNGTTFLVDAWGDVQKEVARRKMHWPLSVVNIKSVEDTAP